MGPIRRLFVSYTYGKKLYKNVIELSTVEGKTALKRKGAARAFFT